MPKGVYKRTKEHLRILEKSRQKAIEASRGSIPWNKGYGDYISGEKHPMFGKHHSVETKKRISNTRIAKGLAKGKNNPRYGKPSWCKGKKRPKHAEIMRRKWQEIEYRTKVARQNGERLAKLNKEPSFTRKRLKGLIKRPSSIERKLIRIIKHNEFPFRYVGDGEYVVDGKNPDFINHDETKIIEAFGTYWHDLKDQEAKEAFFGEHGYATLIIWEEELTDEKAIVKKIASFSEQALIGVSKEA